MTPLLSAGIQDVKKIEVDCCFELKQNRMLLINARGKN